MREPLGGRRNLAAFLRLQGRVAAVAAKVEDVAKRIEKALVKPFCEKKLHRIFVRLEKMVSVFLSSPITSVRIDDF